MAMKSADRSEPDGDHFTAWDPELTRRLVGFLAPALRRYFRVQVRGLENIPHAGGALLVSNHSGGQFTLDVPILAVEFYEKFGYDRSMTTLAHDILLAGPLAKVLPRLGLIRANRENANTALRDGQVVVVFPGGDYDAYRPTFSQNVIDFNGRKGYVTTAIEAGAPVIPVVSVGGQENQFYVTRGEGLAKRISGLAKGARLSQLPIAIGLPFGISLGGLLPPNIPLPTKIVTQILEPIDIAAEFGTDPNTEEVDAHVRDVMQCALNKLRDERRFPVLG
jgi:1-acyl-sn-glycerol-3-phosphate acyltransferase